MSLSLSFARFHNVECQVKSMQLPSCIAIGLFRQGESQMFTTLFHLFKSTSLIRLTIKIKSVMIGLKHFFLQLQEDNNKSHTVSCL